MRNASLPAVLFTLLLGLLVAPGCRALAMPWLMWGQEPTKKVPAESRELDSRRVAIVVWVETQTQFEFQFVQLEISDFVRYGLEGRVKGITFVPNKQIVDLQRREPKWDSVDPATLGKRFDADRVLYIEIGQYTTRDAESSYLLRGRIDANVSVWDSGARDGKRLYQTRIEAVFPPENSAEWGTDEQFIRRRTMELFARLTAEKFYDREVKVK